MKINIYTFSRRFFAVVSFFLLSPPLVRLIIIIFIFIIRRSADAADVLWWCEIYKENYMIITTRQHSTSHRCTTTTNDASWSAWIQQQWIADLNIRLSLAHADGWSWCSSYSFFLEKESSESPIIYTLLWTINYGSPLGRCRIESCSRNAPLCRYSRRAALLVRYKKRSFALWVLRHGCELFFFLMWFLIAHHKRLPA